MSSNSTPTDTSVEATAASTVEATADAPVESTVEAPVDVAPEASAETSVEAAVEAPVDVPVAERATAPAIDCAAKLKELFPALFVGPPKPLKLRIQADIQERAPGVFTKQMMSAFFRRFTGSHAYLIALTKATHRFDLDGAPAGEISDEHRKAANDELARRRGNQDARRALEEEQRRNRATLLFDFQRTTLTPANFCALKGIAVEELEGLLEIAKREAAEQPRPAPAFDRGRRDGVPPRGAGEGRRDGPRGPGEGRRDGPPRAAEGQRRDGPRRDARGPGPNREGGPARDGQPRRRG